MKSKSSSNIIPANYFARLVLATVLVLLGPAVAMQFSDEVNWGPEDFVAIAVLLLGAGLLYDLIASRVRTKNHRIVVGIFLLALLMYVWAELAVGIFTHLGS